VTLQRVVKQRMTIETHNWASSAHQEFHKIIKEEILPIVNQVDARVQNFEKQFLKKATKFVGDFKSLAKEADASLSKHKILELDIERLLKAVVSQDIISVVQNASVVDTSDLQTELEPKFVGDFKSLAKEADESLAKHKTLELEIERLLRAVVSQDIMSVVQKTFVVDTSNLQTELECMKECFENCIIKKKNEYAKLWNDWYKKCNECKFDKILYDKAYKDMQQKIERLQAQLGDLKGKSKDTSCVSDTLNPLSQKLKSENVELEFQLRAQLFNKVSDQKDNKRGTSPNTKLQSNQSWKIFPRINPFKTSREEKHVPNNVRASARIKPITVSQHPVITKKDISKLSLNVRKNTLKTVSLKRKQNMLNFGMIDTQNPLSQKLKNENVELEFQVLNYARENAHLKATYKNLFDSISVSRTQTKTIIASLQNEFQSNIYKNTKLKTQLFKKVSDQKDNTQDTSKNTKFAKQPIVENLPTIGKPNALSNPVTSNSVSSPQESKGVNNDKVIAPGMFRINPSKTSREEKQVPNTVRVDNTKTRRPQPRSNTKHDRIPFASKSSRSKNKEAEVEEHHRNLLLSKNNKHISSACNNIKIDSQDVISKVVCAMCKKCLISVNHDKCLSKNVNGKNSCEKNQKAKIYVKEIQKNYQPKVVKPKKVESHKSLATPKPRKSRLLLRWSPTGRFFNQEGKIVDSSESKSKSDCSNGDNACTSNAMEPKIKRFPNSTSLLDKLFRFVYGASIRVVPSI
nr:hypothetical protein [Tanacetum cinerariifolium]